MLFRSREIGSVRRVNEDLGIACGLQQGTGREIGEDEPGARVHQQVAERVEEEIAGVLCPDIVCPSIEDAAESERQD